MCTRFSFLSPNFEVSNDLGGYQPLLTTLYWADQGVSQDNLVRSFIWRNPYSVSEVRLRTQLPHHVYSSNSIATSWQLSAIYIKSRSLFSTPIIGATWSNVIQLGQPRCYIIKRLFVLFELSLHPSLTCRRFSNTFFVGNYFPIQATLSCQPDRCIHSSFQVEGKSHAYEWLCGSSSCSTSLSVRHRNPKIYFAILCQYRQDRL